MSAVPKLKPMTRDEALALLRARAEVAELTVQLERLSGPPNSRDLVAALDLAITRNANALAAKIEHAMRTPRINPHTDLTDVQAIELGEHVIKSLLVTDGDRALLIDAVAPQLRKAVASCKYPGWNSPSLRDRRKLAGDLKDRIAARKCAINAMRQPSDPREQQLLEEVARKEGLLQCLR